MVPQQPLPVFASEIIACAELHPGVRPTLASAELHHARVRSAMRNPMHVLVVSEQFEGGRRRARQDAFDVPTFLAVDRQDVEISERAEPRNLRQPSSTLN